MTDNESLRESLVKFLQQLTQSPLLLIGPGVSGRAIIVIATLVADADAVPVIRIAVRSLLFNGSAVLNGSVTSYNIMVSDTFPVLTTLRDPLLVPFVNLLGRAGLIGSDAAAMYYQKSNCSHIIKN